MYDIVYNFENISVFLKKVMKYKVFYDLMFVLDV